MRRRSFLAALAVLPVITALAGTRLPRLEEESEDTSGTIYWMANDQFYVHDGVALTSMAHPEGHRCVNGHPFCNLCVGPDLTEKSLEELCERMREIPNPVIRPTQRIVSPAEYEYIQSRTHDFDEPGQLDLSEDSLEWIEIEVPDIRPRWWRTLFVPPRSAMSVYSRPRSWFDRLLGV